MSSNSLIELKILNRLAPYSMTYTAGWEGGKTATELAEDIGCHVNTIRKYLRLLRKEGKLWAFAPHNYQREDGHNGNTEIWFSKGPELL